MGAKAACCAKRVRNTGTYAPGADAGSSSSAFFRDEVGFVFAFHFQHYSGQKPWRRGSRSRSRNLRRPAPNAATASIALLGKLAVAPGGNHVWCDYSRREWRSIPMKVITFGRAWYRAKKKLLEPWDEPKARIAHELRHPYIAVIENDGKVSCFIEVNNDYFGIAFLDDTGREFLSYQFQEVAPESLFLTMATHREFDDKSDRVKSGTTYYFRTNGSVVIETEDFVPAQLTTMEVQADVSGNWEVYPKFGNYCSVAKAERPLYRKTEPSTNAGP